MLQAQVASHPSGASHTPADGKDFLSTSMDHTGQDMWKTQNVDEIKAFTEFGDDLSKKNVDLYTENMIRLSNMRGMMPRWCSKEAN